MTTVDKSHLNSELMLNPEQRDLEPAAPGMVGHCRMFSELKSIDHDKRTIDFVCSSNTVDRYGEIVEPEAFRDSLKDFMLNPAFPAGHWYEFAGGKTPTVGHWKSMLVQSNKLIGKAWFKPRGLGEECWLDFIDGCLTSVSVAFLSRAWEMREMKLEGETRRVRVFTKVDLIECIAVLIPANPQARIRAAGYAQVAEPQLKSLQTLLERIEKKLDAGHDGFANQSSLDDAEDWFGRDGYGDEYFGDIHDAGDTPNPRSDHQGGDNHELKAVLRDTLSVREATA